MRHLTLTLAALLPLAASAAPTSILFVGNSFTFGRVDPVMSYNAGEIRDLTAPMFATNPTGSNLYEPRPWGGVAGIFKQFTVQAGLDYDVAMSTRNAASLRGHFLNSNPAGWDLRGNLSSQTWDQVVLQEQSDEPLNRRGSVGNPAWFTNYVDKIEDFLHQGTAHTYQERDFFPGATPAERTAACRAATGASTTTCTADRVIPANTRASASTEVFLYQTWARPNFVDGAFRTITDDTTGAVTRTTTPATTYFSTLEAMTEELRLAYESAARNAAADGTGGIKAVAPVGEAFMRAVVEGVATRDMWAADAGSDGLIDLWFDDGLHASKHGSYLSALTLFGRITGVNPFWLGAGEIAARDLGISRADAVALQRIAALELGFSVPLPGSAGLALAALLLMGAVTGGRRRA